MIELLGEVIEMEVSARKMGLHALQLYLMNSLSGDLPEVEAISDLEPYYKKFPSATGLHEARVRFKTNGMSGIGNITFHHGLVRFKTNGMSGIGNITFHHGLVRLSSIAIHISMDAFLLNMMVFEQLHVKN
ncbi:hypothetical protein AMTRI_Chr06g193950 [Amborella trichopoda]